MCKHFLSVGSEVHHLQTKIAELSSEVDALKEEKTVYQNKAAELVNMTFFKLLTIV
jgi:outer membrane murein-binding lipoprotein Lpp